MLARNHGCIWMQVRARTPRTSLFVQLQTGEPDLESAGAIATRMLWLAHLALSTQGSFNMSRPDFVSWLPLKLQRDTHLDGFSVSVQSQVSLPMLLCPWKLSMHHWKTRKEEQIQVLRMSMGIHMQQDHDAMQGASNEHMPPSMQMWIWKANRQITQCGAMVIVQEPTDNW